MAAVGDAEDLDRYTVTAEISPTAEAVVHVSHVSDGEARSFKTGWVEGLHYPPFVTQERFEWLRASVKLRRDDVVVVTYAKCGTTWIEQIVLLLLAKGDASKLDPLHKNAYTEESGCGKIWLEASLRPSSGAASGGGEMTPVSLAHFEHEMPSPRVIKTHAPRRLLLGLEAGEVPQGTRLIYVTRNPKDACVSCFYHAFNPHKQGWSFGAWAAAWASGRLPHGGWFAHVREWRAAFEASGDSPRLWLHYESMQRDPAAAVKAVAELLWPEGMPDWCDADAIAAVARESNFDTMKAHLTADVAKREAAGLAVWAHGGHLRKGQTGDWRSHFSPQLSKSFDKLFAEQMQGTGLTYDQGLGEQLVAPP